MDSALSKYIEKTRTCILQNDPLSFRDCITISPQDNQGMVRAQFPIASEFDLYSCPEKFRDVIRNYLNLMKSVYIDNDIEKSFQDINEMVNCLIRAASAETNWINTALTNSCTELINIYRVKQKANPENENLEDADEELETGGNSVKKMSSIEILTRTINKAFTLSLNDKNPILNQSRRIDIYFFLSHLIKLYFKMGKLELAKSVEKALKGTRFELPPLNLGNSSLNYSITYLYYSALLSLDNSDFESAELKLDEALKLSTNYANLNSIEKQREKILLLLIPLKLYNKNQFPSRKLGKSFPNLDYIYRTSLFEAIKNGDVKTFEKYQQKFQVIFLKHHLYLLVENLKKICYYQLIKKTSKIVMNDLNGNHIIPLSAYQVASDYSRYRQTSNKGVKERSLGTHIDEIECKLASLIYSGKVKGYISHSNKCIVLSKTNAFPK